MKKVILLLLAVCMCISVCACGGESTTTSSSSAESSKVESSAVSSEVESSAVSSEVESSAVSSEVESSAVSSEVESSAVSSEVESSAVSSEVESSEVSSEVESSAVESSEPECTNHDFEDATCTSPKTCKICGKTEGKAKDHDWKDADCSNPKTCKVCGKTEGEAKGHDWKNATCTTPRTCKVCGKTRGEVEHNWQEATCKAPKTCKDCGKTEGASASHSWKNADCTKAKTCKICGLTEGAALGHSWKNATCTEAKTCKTCGKTEGAALGHDWKAATCQESKTCKTCGKTDGSKGAHKYSDGVCSVCGAKDPNYVKVYKAGEAWVVPGEWELTINNVTEHILCDNRYNEREGLTGMQGAIVSYTYKNLSSSTISIPSYDGMFGTIELYDGNSEKAVLYSDIYCDHTKDATDCMPGMKATAKHTYALYSNSTSVTIFVTKKDSKGTSRTATFKINVTPAPQEPEEDKMQGYKVTCDTSLPETINYYSGSNIQSSCQVTAVSFEVSGDDLKILMTGKKTYDSKGSGQSASCKIGWKLYNSQNYVVDDGTLYTNSLAVGEGFLNASDTAYDILVPGESYRLVIMNVN